MPLPRATAQSTKDLKLPGHYGHSKKAGAKKASAKKKARSQEGLEQEGSSPFVPQEHEEEEGFS